MGGSRLIPYVIKIECASGQVYTPMEWHVRKPRWQLTHVDGKPCFDNIAKWVESFEASMQPGGTNQHLTPDVVLSAKIIKQSTMEVVATWIRT